MTDKYPSYDVLRKRNGPSWNDKTRAVIDERLALDRFERRHLSERQFLTLMAICDRIIPQNAVRPRPTPLAAFIDRQLTPDAAEGYRDSRLPPMARAWMQGLDAIEDEAALCENASFTDLGPIRQDALLSTLSSGAARSHLWRDMPAPLFFKKRLLHDIVSAYYAFPDGWNEIGFGGPASPRGYVRLGFDRRDPWEAAEARPGEEQQARRENADVR
ncbi:gluconate 2-dehydrogenase subunit 3 family protein [Allorhizobium sp. BGMRC 0089]|uniref:gluconate 2-dehydrogenase subunit 3 family protein n=1 Tax=Allorhizobium sonneratiae TaxID=2934936 RepID=UPI002033EA99|nr:gluconate 2-dehydrogenase subunit 3 family protein [Allorhizobium sonneratiae]MCM2294591.1 gluconate 2-dehydrogenase subunit 3 family protein [Allorhizobium sonneratiae]